MQLPVEGLECHPDQPICTTPSPKRLTVLGGPGERGLILRLVAQVRGACSFVWALCVFCNGRTHPR